MQPVTKPTKETPEGRTEPTPTATRQLAVRVPEAARLLDIGRSKCYDLIRRGELPAIWVGKSVRVPLAALTAWVEKMAHTPADPSLPDNERKRYGP